uniref:C2H2-type domain-containing protein n=1 Tax=viral metagenome TaxID=1070528 RepID=A0A6C0ERA6_9ZZZZ
MLTQKSQKVAKKFICETCDYKCSNSYDFNKHLTTRKHKMLTNANFDANTKIATPSIVYKCDCGTTYNHKSSLSRHKKSCNKPNNSSNEPDKLVNTILELVKENQQFKNMLIEQHNHILKISEKPTIANCNNNNNNNNKNFNMNFFLNEQCKNAINLSEFVENVKLELADLENIADIGYVDGVTQIFMNGLKNMDIYTRPLHCTDIKREILHIRENNSWIKDTPDQEKIKSAIRRIAFRNIQQISHWNKQHPESEVLDTTDYNRSFQIMRESLGNTCPGGVDRNNERIVKNIIKTVYIDKHCLLTQYQIDDK